MPPGHARVLVLLAPGAGAPSSSAWMRAWAERLSSVAAVETFDYAYARAGRKAPDRLPLLIEAHRAALSAARAKHGFDLPFVLAGKSMGSRVGCHLAVELAQAREAAGGSAPRSDSPHEPTEPAGILCFGYPLAPPRGGALRDRVLRALAVPILFVQGTRDPLCPLDRLAEVRAEMAAPSRLHVVEGGDHSLSIRKRDLEASGRSQAGAEADAFAAVAAFLAEISRRGS